MKRKRKIIRKGIYHLTIFQEYICVFFPKGAEEVEGYNGQRTWKYLNLS